MTYLLKLLFSAALCFLLSASLAVGASVSVSPATGNSFILQGNNLDGISGIELVVSFSGSLSAPVVTPGSLISSVGALFTPNPSFSANSIKIATITTNIFSGNGVIANIRFAQGSGSLQILSQKMIDSTGTSTGAETPLTSTSPFVSLNTPSTYLGSVTMPTDVQVPPQPQPKTGDVVKPTDTSVEAAKVAEPAVAKPVEPPAEKKAGTEPQKPEKVTTTSYNGIIDSFREYIGEKSPATLIAIFNKIITPTIRQEPAVVLSDGKTPLKIVVEIPVTSAKSPNFALNGAKLVSLARDASSAWIIETLPQAGVVRASLTILTDSDIIEYPLTLAPLLAGFKPTEAEFALFLKDSGAATPNRDLNGDGKHDYLDDFIYTANFLVRKGDTVKRKN